MGWFPTGPGRMMGPPRAPGPGPQQMDPVGVQMMPPPNQGQGYPAMYPMSSQAYRSAQMPPYGSYPNNQVWARRRVSALSA